MGTGMFTGNVSENQPEDALAEILNYVKKFRGIDFSAYRSNTIGRRLMGRLQSTGMPDYGSYAGLLRDDPKEIEKLVEAFTIKVSHFFRNPFTFEVLRDPILPELLESTKGELRIWSAGCANGEEAYSLAILLREILEKDFPSANILILATDIDRNALAEAEKALYRNESLFEVRKGYLDKYFTRFNDNLYRVNDEVKSMVTFAVHDVTTGSPPKEGIFSDYNVIFCRNVLIYFNLGLQEKVITSFSGMQHRGYLVLGEAESLPARLAGSYNEILPRTKIFRKAGG
ncbi:MAG: protein-glutamate O-methyltransferase CheR [Nitrospirae bacterium]|nr:protein-glutamate O-methyltransferase CheR [Nitrospirota bacterium]